MMLALEGCAHSYGTDQAAPLTCPGGKYNGDKRYAPFFEQVKQVLDAHWDPKTLLRQRDPTGRPLGLTLRYTVLNISLDGQGLLRDVRVERSCGVDFLNELAVSAVREGLPLPKPPAELLRDGIVTFDFGFCAEFLNKPPAPGSD
jgi:TonB family protein